MFSRTGAGRVASAIGRVNNTFETFTKMKFTAMKCSLPENSPGAVLIRGYQRKRDLTDQYRKTRKAMKRKHAHIAEKTKEYFEERTKQTNEGDYYKFQLDRARRANVAATDAVLHAEPGPSHAFDQRLRQAHSTSIHMQDTLDAMGNALDHAYAQQKQAILAKRRSQRIKALNMRTRSKAKNMARSRGSKDTVRLREEHSYGALFQ